MKLLYVANRYDPLKHNDGSGTDYDLHQVFSAHNLEVQIAGPFDYPRTFLEKVSNRFHTLLSTNRPVKYPISYLRKSAQEVEKAIATFKPDILFSFFSAPLAMSKFDVPLVYMIDTTLIGQQDSVATA